MRWTPGGTSSNVEDRRGSGGGMGMGQMGIGGTLILLVLSLVFGRNFLGGSTDGADPQTGSAGGEVAPPATESVAEHKEVQFVSFVLDDVQAMWAKMIPNYRDAKLVLFRGATPTGCGTGQAAMGPFYCPDDEKVYIDLSFYDELRDRFGAPGDFAQAYVLAHELGHHVQHLTGGDAQLRRAQQLHSGDVNQLSIAVELQADCYAGVWGYSAAQRDTLLQAGDVEEGLAAAAAVGDDRIQKETTGRINTDTFTHGSSAQRIAAFRKGFSTGDPKKC